MVLGVKGVFSGFLGFQLLVFWGAFGFFRFWGFSGVLGGFWGGFFQGVWAFLLGGPYGFPHPFWGFGLRGKPPMFFFFFFCQGGLLNFLFFFNLGGALGFCGGGPRFGVVYFLYPGGWGPISGCSVKIGASHGGPKWGGWRIFGKTQGGGFFFSLGGKIRGFLGGSFFLFKRFSVFWVFSGGLFPQVFSCFFFFFWSFINFFACANSPPVFLTKNPFFQGGGPKKFKYLRQVINFFVCFFKASIPL